LNSTFVSQCCEIIFGWAKRAISVRKIQRIFGVFFAWNFRRNGWNFFMQFASRIRDHKSDTNAEHSCARQVDGDFAKNQNRGQAASVGSGLRGAK
jgi:hypothetical protein